MITTIDELRNRAVIYAVGFLWLMVPLIGALGRVLGTGGIAESGLLAMVALLVAVEWRRTGGGLATQMAASAGLAVAVMTIVYLLRGHPWQADSHMIFFAAFALTAVFCDWRPIVTYAVVIAVHHLVLNFMLTAAVFPGDASLGRVLLHAVVLAVEAVPLLWLATVLARLFNHSAGLVTAADAALAVAETQSCAQTAERQEMSGVVDKVEGAMARLAEGDLTVTLGQADLPPRYQGVAETFNANVTALSLMIADVEHGAKRLLQSPEALAEAAWQAADRAGQQLDSIAESSRAMNQLADGVQATTALAAAADAMMAANQRDAQAGGAVLEQAVAAMQRIEESSHQISRISAVMEDIAFQTNLLALNAGVEAARAGELGRGFAVVASEVRELSQRAGDATKDIRTLVSDSRKNVARGAELVGKTSESLGALIKGAGATATIVTEIASKMREQTVGLNALSANTTVIEKTAQSGSQMAQHSSAMGRRLNDDASAMIQAVATFRKANMLQAIAAEQPRRVASAVRGCGAVCSRFRMAVWTCWQRGPATVLRADGRAPGSRVVATDRFPAGAVPGHAT